MLFNSDLPEELWQPGRSVGFIFWVFCYHGLAMWLWEIKWVTSWKLNESKNKHWFVLTMLFVENWMNAFIGIWKLKILNCLWNKSCPDRHCLAGQIFPSVKLRNIANSLAVFVWSQFFLKILKMFFFLHILV